MAKRGVIRRSVLVLLLPAVWLTGWATMAAAEEVPRISVLPTEPELGQPASAQLVRGRVLRSTAVLTDNAGTIVPAGAIFPLHDPVTLLCPRNTRGPCTFEAEISVQVSSSTSPANSVALCARVDGEDMNPPNCIFVGRAVPDAFLGQTFTFALSGIRQGRREVQSFIFLGSEGTVRGRTIVYRVYKPN